jgi:branched-chain amino acid aminotransferase
MSQLANQRVVYLNGEIVPESEALIPFRDRGFRYGDAVFDMTRTFGHRIFRLQDHIERLYKSLRYVQVDPGVSVEKMTEISREVLERNLHLLEKGDDYWVGQRISRGVDVPGGDISSHGGPTVIVECTPLPLKARARVFRDGVDVIVPSVRRTPPDALSPNAKTHNYLNLIMGDLEVKAQDPEAWAVTLDVNGNLCEGMGSNIFTVSDGALVTPLTKYVLPGISRQTVVDMANELGIPATEGDISLYDAYTADEVFLTSTSLCICGVGSVNGVTIGDGTVQGPITRKLMDAYAKHVDFDFEAQYLANL